MREGIRIVYSEGQRVAPEPRPRITQAPEPAEVSHHMEVLEPVTRERTPGMRTVFRDGVPHIERAA